MVTEISHWLDDEAYAKARGQASLQIGEILSVFNLYGLGVLIPGAQEEILEIMEDFSVRTRGDKDQPIRLKSRRNPRRE